MKFKITLFTIGTALLAGCSFSMGGGGTGMMNSMMAIHSASIPDEYAGQVNPIPADDASLARGVTTYTVYCASCHGAGGMGDGSAGAGLDPAPAPIAHTSQMLGDDYLFWRISEGGIPFGTAMPMFKAVLEEDEIWDVINFTRALGSGKLQTGDGAKGESFDMEEELAQREAMLDQAVADGVITRDEADIFLEVHAVIDEMLASGELEPGPGNAEDVRAAWLDDLVASGDITQEQADTFADVHDRLGDAGLMQ